MDTSNIDFTKEVIIVPGSNLNECEWLPVFIKDLSESPLIAKTIPYGYSKQVNYSRLDKKPCAARHITYENSLEDALRKDYFAIYQPKPPQPMVSRINSIEI